MELKTYVCKPCTKDSLPLNKDEVDCYLMQIDKGWEVDGYKKIHKDFSFKSYPETMSFVNNVAQLAETEGHHPDLHVYYSKVVVELWTHTVSGLSINDFILASKIDNICSELYK
jgi:4a-hydroxytetrahydrobiopterin dehydratase